MPHRTGGFLGSAGKYDNPDQMQSGYDSPWPSAGGYQNQAGNYGGGISSLKSDEVTVARAKRHQRHIPQI